MPQPTPDRLRALVDVLVAALDARTGDHVAARAHLSRFHFDRLVSDGVGEAPGALRRRLLLERAAWQLAGGATVTDAGLDAGYGSTEAFSRAFARAHGTPPSRFAAGGADFRLAAPNGIHFHPPAGLLVAHDPRSAPMDLAERLLEHDRSHTAALLRAAAALDDEALDREVEPGHEVLSFDGPEPSLRAMLDNLVWTKEVWAAAIGGHAAPPREPAPAVPRLQERFDGAGDAFLAVVRDVAARGAWDDTFVDALCEPPQSFTFGGVVAHVLTFSAHRRQVAADALASLGVEPPPLACPIEWERQRVTDASLPADRLRGTGR